MKTKHLLPLILLAGLLLGGTLHAQIFEINDSGTIGEYNLDGSTVNASLISDPDGPLNLVVSGSDIFVVNFGYGKVGEYTTTGGTVNASLIPGLGSVQGIAVSGSDIYVTNFGGTIGEYTTTGGTVNASLISGLSNPSAIAISGSDIYVTYNNMKVAEFTTSGSTVNSSLISFSAGAATGIAVSGSNLFVANTTNTGGTIGEYNFDGTPVDGSLISVPSNDPSSPPGNAITVEPIPEPATWAMLAMGGTGSLIFASRRRVKSHR